MNEKKAYLVTVMTPKRLRVVAHNANEARRRAALCPDEILHSIEKVETVRRQENPA